MAVVRYLVDDVDAAVAFYTDNLGFTLQQQMGPAFAIVSRDDLSLWLSGPQSSAARAMPDGRRPEPGGWNRLVVEVDDLETKVDELKQQGRQNGRIRRRSLDDGRGIFTAPPLNG